MQKQSSRTMKWVVHHYAAGGESCASTQVTLTLKSRFLQSKTISKKDNIYITPGTFLGIEVSFWKDVIGYWEEQEAGGQHHWYAACKWLMASADIIKWFRFLLCDLTVHMMLSLKPVWAAASYVKWVVVRHTCHS